MAEGVKIKKKRVYFSSRTALGVMTVAAFSLLLVSSDVAIEYMKKGLGLCAVTVIPSLFPFMIMSELIVSSGVGVRISRVFAKPMRWLFGVSEAGAAAYFLGIICGFPIGAKTAVSMYDKGIISKRETERLLTFCNNPGSAFVMSAVGVSLLHSYALGIMLYVCVILSSIAIGVIGHLFERGRKSEAKTVAYCSQNDAVKAVTDAIQSSALSMLSVCAYVVFFSAIVGCLGAAISRFSFPEEILAVIFGFFELSSGVGAAAGLDGRLSAVLLCALFLGWSGISVHFQIMSVCSGRGLSFKAYFLSKIAQGILCAAMAGCAVKLFPRMIEVDHAAFLPLRGAFGRYCGVAFLAFLAISLFIALWSYAAKKHFLKNKNEFFSKRY